MMNLRSLKKGSELAAMVRTPHVADLEGEWTYYRLCIPIVFSAFIAILRVLGFLLRHNNKRIYVYKGVRPRLKTDDELEAGQLIRRALDR